MDSKSAILTDVETFLTASGMPPTNFGRGALNDPRLVHGLRNGRRLYPETEARVRKFMSEHPTEGMQ